MRLLNLPRRSLTAAAAISVSAALVVAGRAPADEPPVFAITNARIVTVSGPPVAKGTIVIRKGVIEAVGAEVLVPGDARILDAAGLTVYPGLIDALSDIGLDEAQQPATGARGAGPPGQPAAAPSALAQPAMPQAADERQGLTPYRLAVDLLNPGNRKIESARSAGITTAVAAPQRGIFTGQSALVNLSGGDPGRMVVKTPLAFHLNLAASGSALGYPSAPMGVLAFVRQTVLDARHYALAWSAYGARPGAERPAYSRALEALLPAVRREIAVVISAGNSEEIRRALDLADKYELRAIISGAAEASKSAALLGERKIPVLVGVKYPERERDPDPEAVEELRQFRRRVEAPANAAALAKAGVRFAFQSGDMANPRDFVRNVARAVEAGLDRDTALRALTLTAAEIFGVADRFGSIETGKTANLVLATGDLFDAATRIKYVFVDGQRFEPSEPEPPAPAERGEKPAADLAAASGTWTLTVESPQGAIPVTLALRQSGSSVTGTVTSAMGTAEVLDGRLSGDRLTFRISAGNMEVSFTATIQGTAIRGSLTAGSMGTMNFSGSRGPQEL